MESDDAALAGQVPRYSPEQVHELQIWAKDLKATIQKAEQDAIRRGNASWLRWLAALGEFKTKHEIGNRWAQDIYNSLSKRGYKDPPGGKDDQVSEDADERQAPNRARPHKRRNKGTADFTELLHVINEAISALDVHVSQYAKLAKPDDAVTPAVSAQSAHMYHPLGLPQSSTLRETAAWRPIQMPDRSSSTAQSLVSSSGNHFARRENTRAMVHEQNIQKGHRYEPLVRPKAPIRNALPFAPLADDGLQSRPLLYNQVDHFTTLNKSSQHNTLSHDDFAEELEFPPDVDQLLSSDLFGDGDGASPAPGQSGTPPRRLLDSPASVYPRAATASPVSVYKSAAHASPVPTRTPTPVPRQSTPVQSQRMNPSGIVTLQVATQTPLHPNVYQYQHHIPPGPTPEAANHVQHVHSHPNAVTQQYHTHSATQGLSQQAPDPAAFRPSINPFAMSGTARTFTQPPLATSTVASSTTTTGSHGKRPKKMIHSQWLDAQSDGINKLFREADDPPWVRKTRANATASATEPAARGSAPVSAQAAPTVAVDSGHSEPYMSSTQARGQQPQRSRQPSQQRKQRRLQQSEFYQPYNPNGHPRRPSQ